MSRASVSRLLRLSLCLLLIVVASATVAPRHVVAAVEVSTPEELLIGVKGASEEVVSLVEAEGGVVLSKIDAINVLLVRVEGLSAQALAVSLESNPLVRYVEPNGVVEIPVEVAATINASEVAAALTPNDALWFSDPMSGLGQWNMRVIAASLAWDVHMGNRAVKVAVIDTGILKEHADIRACYVAGGWDWVNNDSDPTDDHGHGTAVAGVVAAEINNGYGIAGLAQVSVMAEKVLDRTGSGTWFNVAKGIVHAADLGAHIISMSFGGYTYSATLESAVNYAHIRGCLLIAAAGNGNTNTPFYPAALPDVLSVASTYGEPDSRAPYSNFGSWIAVSAPGGFDENLNGRVDVGEHWVLSTYRVNDQFVYLYGTSLAAPHVSGLAALYKSRYPESTQMQLAEVLKKTADDKGAQGWDQYYGYGRVNAYRALTTPPVPSVGGQAELLHAPDMSLDRASSADYPLHLYCSCVVVAALIMLTSGKQLIRYA